MMPLFYKHVTCPACSILALSFFENPMNIFPTTIPIPIINGRKETMTKVSFQEAVNATINADNKTDTDSRV